MGETSVCGMGRERLTGVCVRPNTRDKCHFRCMEKVILGFVFPKEGVSEARRPAPDPSSPQSRRSLLPPQRWPSAGSTHLWGWDTRRWSSFLWSWPLESTHWRGLVCCLVSHPAPQHRLDPLSSSVHPCGPQRTSLECSRNDLLPVHPKSLSRRKREKRWEGTADLPTAARACAERSRLRPEL